MIRKIGKILPAFIVLLIAACVLMGGCRRSKVIPDDKLKLIFREIYLANAFVQEQGYTMDTLEIYTPIFAKYGYRIEDLKNTVDNFSRRKSSKFSDIIKAASDSLETESRGYLAAVKILDTIDYIAGERYKKQIYFKDSLKVYAIKDTAKLTIKMGIERGRYKISYRYKLDTMDENRNLRSSHTISDSSRHFTGSTNNWFVAGESRLYTVDMNATSTDRKLTLQMAGYPKNGMKKPSLRFDSIEVTYYLPKDVALDSMNREISSKFYPLILKEDAQHTQDSISLPFPMRRADPKRDSLHAERRYGSERR